jgi:transposase-like protein
MGTVSRCQDDPDGRTLDVELSPAVQTALGDLAGAAKEGLLALSVGVGLGVLEELMGEEVDALCGPKGRHDPARTAVRHGRDDGTVTLGGRRLAVRKPRVRSKNGENEIPLSIYAHFASRDPLAGVVLERMLAGVSTRRYRRLQEPVGSGVETRARSTSKSSVSRTFIACTQVALGELMARRLDDLRLAVLMIDGIELQSHTNIVALGITTEGIKVPVGLWEGSTENKTVVTALLADLVSRGLDATQGVLAVLDGSKALRAGVNRVLGTRTPVQRCIRHKERDVAGHLPERMREPVVRRLRAAWANEDYEQALSELRDLARELERQHPGAAASLREGMEETLTVTKLGIVGKLKQTLQSTNPVESMIDTIGRISRNVKNWSSGKMTLRWTAAGMLEAEKQFRRVRGYAELGQLAVAVERLINSPQLTPATPNHAVTINA